MGGDAPTVFAYNNPMNTDQSKFAQLDALLDNLIEGSIHSIEYIPTVGSGLVHHRIEYIPAVGGRQLCIRMAYAGSGGSGMYFGNDKAALIAKVGSMIADFERPHPNPKIRAFLANRGPDKRSYTYRAVA